MLVVSNVPLRVCLDRCPNSSAHYTIDRAPISAVPDGLDAVFVDI